MPADATDAIKVVTTGDARPSPGGRRVPYYLHILDNIPYAAIGILGAWVLWYVHWSMAMVELAASVLGPLWMIMTVCKHCSLYGKASCLAGYGLISAKLVSKGDPERFGEMFVHHTIPVMPMYFLPVVGMGYLAWSSGLDGPWLVFIAFCVVAFLAVPLKARYITCAKCPKRGDCPWGSRAAVPKGKKGGSRGGRNRSAG